MALLVCQYHRPLEPENSKYKPSTTPRVKLNKIVCMYMYVCVCVCLCVGVCVCVCVWGCMCVCGVCVGVCNKINC